MRQIEDSWKKDDERAYLLCLCILFLNSVSLGGVTMSAESVGGPTPGVRVTWSTTVPPECVASVTVKFKLSEMGNLSSTYNTTNISEAEVIQTGLRCATKYYIRVVVDRSSEKGKWKSLQEEFLVGGNKLKLKSQQYLMVVMLFHRYTSPIWSES